MAAHGIEEVERLIEHLGDVGQFGLRLCVQRYRRCHCDSWKSSKRCYIKQNTYKPVTHLHTSDHAPQNYHPCIPANQSPLQAFLPPHYELMCPLRTPEDAEPPWVFHHDRMIIKWNRERSGLRITRA